MYKYVYFHIYTGTESKTTPSPEIIRKSSVEQIATEKTHIYIYA
jgi:hypothetical protein